MIDSENRTSLPDKACPNHGMLHSYQPLYVQVSAWKLQFEISITYSQNVINHHELSYVLNESTGVCLNNPEKSN